MISYTESDELWGQVNVVQPCGRDDLAYVFQEPVSVIPSDIRMIEQAAALLKVHPVALRRRAKAPLAFPPLLVDDDLASNLDLTSNQVRSYAREILSLQRFGARSSRFDKTGAWR